MRTMIEMLSFQRPMYSAEDDQFLELYFRTLESHPNVSGMMEDEMGNVIIEVCGGSKTLFCAHSDTVHMKGGRQVPVIKSGGIISVDGPNCLGADDTAGCWMIREIVKAGIPSVCIITRGEERGGHGSKHLAKSNEEFMQQFDRAIAFDRKGQTSVITHQGWERCCSDVFANALADAINLVSELTMAPDSGGIYTDTAEWVGIIPECTNISIGYEAAHTASETLDFNFVKKLRDAIVLVDWESLPTVRDPSQRETLDYTLGNYGGINFSRKATFQYGIDGEPRDEYDIADMDYHQIVKWVKSADARDVADILLQLSETILYGSGTSSVTPSFKDQWDEDDDDYGRLDVGMR